MIKHFRPSFFVLFCLMAFGLTNLVYAQAAPQHSESVWSYETYELEMGGLAHLASVKSTNTLEFDFPYAGEQKGNLYVSTSDGHVSTSIHIEKGQILCRSYEPCLIQIRLNDEPSQSHEARGSSDGSNTILFLEGGKQIARQIVQAERVRVQFPVYQHGSQVLDFNTSGFQSSLWLDSTIGKRPEVTPGAPVETTTTRAANVDTSAATGAVWTGILLWLVVVLIFYFVPTAVAQYRKAANTTTVLIVNLFLGWTVIGWIIALILAFAGDSGAQAKRHQELLNAMQRQKNKPEGSP